MWRERRLIKTYLNLLQKYFNAHIQLS